MIAGFRTVYSNRIKNPFCAGIIFYIWRAVNSSLERDQSIFDRKSISKTQVYLDQSNDYCYRLIDTLISATGHSPVSTVFILRRTNEKINFNKPIGSVWYVSSKPNGHSENFYPSRPKSTMKKKKNKKKDFDYACIQMSNFHFSLLRIQEAIKR